MMLAHSTKSTNWCTIFYQDVQEHFAKSLFGNSKGREWFLKKLFTTAFAADGNYEWSKINIVKMTAVGGGFL